MPVTATNSAPQRTHADRVTGPRMDDAVLATLAYSDLFDYPLSSQEVHADLVVRAPLEDVLAALDRLVPSAISRLDGDLFCLRGREDLAGLRRQRWLSNREGWRQAHRFARWLTLLPFLRTVAVCGSLAVDNAGPDGDVDLFLITAPRRLWLVQAATMILRRLARGRGAPSLCPNYLLTEADLEVGPRNLFVAHEVTQARPIVGAAGYHAFRQANAWTRAYLPQRTAATPTDADAPRSRPFRRLLEAALGGTFGDLLDRTVHRLLLAYYRLRLKRFGWSRDDIASTYRRDRQTVMTGGYLGAVAARFLDRCGNVFGDPGVGESFFYRGFAGNADGDLPGHGQPSATPADESSSDPVYAELFDRHYGDGA